MALSKVVYVNGVTVITAENLNDIQDAIIALESGASITVDAALSATSENPVQNKVIALALGQKANSADVPTKTSDLQNDSGYLTQHQSLADYRTSQAQDEIDLQQNAAIEAKYTKPDGGVPKTDMAEDVKTSLGRADTALQQHQDISGKADKVTEVTVSTAGDVTQALDAGKVYHFTGALTALTLTLNAAAAGQQQYHLDFVSGATAPTVTIPATVTMPDGWTVEANTRYEIDILDGYGVAQSWEVTA